MASPSGKHTFPVSVCHSCIVKVAELRFGRSRQRQMKSTPKMFCLFCFLSLSFILIKFLMIEDCTKSCRIIHWSQNHFWIIVIVYKAYKYKFQDSTFADISRSWSFWGILGPLAFWHPLRFCLPFWKSDSIKKRRIREQIRDTSRTTPRYV